MKKYLILAACILCFTVAVKAQDRSAGTHSIYMKFGLDYSLTTATLGYKYQPDSQGIYPRNLSIFTEASLPLFQLDAGEWRIDAGVELNALQWNSFVLPLRAAIIYRGMTNELISCQGLGTEFSLSPGYETEHWSLGAHVSWDAQWLTWLNYSSYYYDWVYSQAELGPFYSTAQSYRLGLQGSLILGEDFLLGFQGGYQYNGSITTILPPFYGKLLMGYSINH